jgi:hypothetical protein
MGASDLVETGLVAAGELMRTLQKKLDKDEPVC